MYCSNCGFKLQEFSKFCSSCGKTVSEIPDKNIQNSKESEESINILSEYPIENLNTEQIPNPKITPSDQNINYSGFWRRVAAWLVDALIFTIPGLILIYFIDYAMYLNPLFWIFGILSSLGYQIYFLKKYNATPGKIFVGLKIIPIDLGIKHLDTMTIIKRQIGFFISGLVFFIGFIIQPFNKKKRAMHDFIAKTIVVDEKKRSSWMIFTIIISSYIMLSIVNLKVAPLINPKLFINIREAVYQAVYQNNDDVNSPKNDASEAGSVNSVLSDRTVAKENDNSKKESYNTRRENTYFQSNREFNTRLKDSKRVMVVQIALGTIYGDQIFENFKKHEFAIRSEIFDVMEQTTEADASHPEFRANLASNIKDVINNILKKYEGFGGIEDVFFTSFVMQ